MEDVKQNLRVHFKALRNLKEAKAAGAADAKIIKRLIKLSCKAKTVFCYVSFGSEVPTHNYIKQMLILGKIVCVPKTEGDKMHAVKITGLENLKPSGFGVLEPELPAARIDTEEIDLIVVPMLAFNKNKYRIGYGGGYYDKFLEKCTAQKIGLAYTFQKTKVQFQKPHDVKLDRIISK